MDILYTFKSFFQEIFSNSKNKSVFSVTLVTEKTVSFLLTRMQTRHEANGHKNAGFLANRRFYVKKIFYFNVLRSFNSCQS